MKAQQFTFIPFNSSSSSSDHFDEDDEGEDYSSSSSAFSTDDEGGEDGVTPSSSSSRIGCAASSSSPSSSSSSSSSSYSGNLSEEHKSKLKLYQMKFTYLKEPRKRTRTTNEQLEILLKAFDKDPIPGPKQRKILAEKTNMTPRSVQVWFQNRRAKYRNPTNATTTTTTATTATTTATVQTGGAASSKVSSSSQSPKSPTIANNNNNNNNTPSNANPKKRKHSSIEDSEDSEDSRRQSIKSPSLNSLTPNSSPKSAIKTNSPNDSLPSCQKSATTTASLNQQSSAAATTTTSNLMAVGPSTSLLPLPLPYTTSAFVHPHDSVSVDSSYLYHPCVVAPVTESSLHFYGHLHYPSYPYHSAHVHHHPHPLSSSSSSSHPNHHHNQTQPFFKAEPFSEEDDDSFENTDYLDSSAPEDEDHKFSTFNFSQVEFDVTSF